MFANETLRRRVSGLLQILGWWGSLGLGLWAAFSFNPAKGHFAPQWVGFGYIGLLGIAIAATHVRSRMRLQAAILKAFETGMRAQQMLFEEHAKQINTNIDNSHQDDE